MKLHTLTPVVCHSASLTTPAVALLLSRRFSSSQGPDSEWAHANRAVLSCLLKEINEKEMAEFPGEWGSASSCLAAPIIHPLHITYANIYICAWMKKEHVWPLYWFNAQLHRDNNTNTRINKEWPSARFDKTGRKCSSLKVFKGNFLQLHFSLVMTEKIIWMYTFSHFFKMFARCN